MTRGFGPWPSRARSGSGRSAFRRARNDTRTGRDQSGGEEATGDDDEAEGAVPARRAHVAGNGQGGTLSQGIHQPQTVDHLDSRQILGVKRRAFQLQGALQNHGVPE